MDEETQAALELTKEELLAMREAGAPGHVAKRPRDLNQRVAEIVREATEDRGSGIRAAWDEDSVVVEHIRFGGHGMTAFVVSSSSAETANILPVR